MKPFLALLGALGLVAIGWNYWATRQTRPVVSLSGRFSSDGASRGSRGFASGPAQPATSLTGVIRMAGSTSHGAHVELVRMAENGSARVYASEQALGDGRFTFNRVMRAPYWVVARTEVDPDPMRPGEGVPQVFYGMAETISDGEKPGHVAIQLFPAATLTGRVVLNSSSKAAAGDFARLTVSLAPMDAQARAAIATGEASAALSADGRFTIGEVPPGRYRLDVSPTSWTVDAVNVSNEDRLGRAFVVAAGDRLTAAVTLTERPNEINGTLRDGAGRALPFMLVAVFPADSSQRESHRRVQLIRSDARGVFRFDGLPSGDYLLSGVVGLEPTTWRTAEFFRQLTTDASRVTIGRGRAQTHDLKVDVR